MTETKQERQSRSKSCRRWFSDDYFDLIVWQDGKGDILRFELCYGKNIDEHAFIWDQESGHSHHKVDDGERVLGRYKMSPIFTADGCFDRDITAERFLEAGRDIDRKITKFVYSKLKDCNMRVRNPD